MKTSNVILFLVGGAIIYYLITSELEESKENIDPNDVTKWDDAKINQYLVESCGVKKKGLITGTHEKAPLFDAVKKEAIKRNLNIPKCAISSIDYIDQSFSCPKCGKSPCKCKPLSIGDMSNSPLVTATGAMPKCGEGTKFINGRCLPIPKVIKHSRPKPALKQIPPSDAYAFPVYINPEGEGFTLQNQ